MNFLHHQARTLSYSGAVRVLRMQLASAMVSKRKPFAAIKKYGERVRSTIASLNVTRSVEEMQSQTALSNTVFLFLWFVSFSLPPQQRERNEHKLRTHARVAFTLAEVLITIGILGLIADMTIPTLITKVNDKALQTAKTVANLKFEEALNQMRANDKLTGYDTADKFANEFTKYIKTAQRCTSTNLTKCFPDIIKTEDKDIQTKDLKTGTNIAPPGKEANYPSNNVGLTLPSGIMAILNYDKTCEWKNPLTGGGTNRKDAMTCISMVYDVNGRKKPNKVGTDIILLNADLNTCLTVGSICIDPNDTPYTAINTCDGSPDIEFDPQGSKNVYCANNMWAGAKKACKDKNMHLATMEDLGQIAKEIYHLSSPPGYQTDLDDLTYDPSIVTKLNIPIEWGYWSSRLDNSNSAYTRVFYQSGTYCSYYNNGKDTSYLARCVR